MAEAPDLDIKMDPTTLYREEVFTDHRIGTIRALFPVTTSGAPDPSRETMFVGEAQIVTQMGPLPISFDIEASSLAAAVDGYASAAKAAIERTILQLQEMRRQAASPIIVPGSAAGGLPPGGLGGGGPFRAP
ncbi:MAG TPA: hypothetical protein VMK42_20475 [Anaeromyxobacteraceae bacterium]|nr:hypothetical protein [Anaeromyxobacteraceae bacterium]